MLHQRPARAEGKIGSLSQLHNWRHDHNGPRGCVVPLQIRTSAPSEMHQAKEIPQASQSHLRLWSGLVRQMWRRRRILGPEAIESAALVQIHVRLFSGASFWGFLLVIPGPLLLLCFLLSWLVDRQGLLIEVHIFHISGY